MEWYVISFINTHSAMTAQKHLKERFKIVIMPTPREISQGCGIAIRIRSEDHPAVTERLKEISSDTQTYRIYGFSNGSYTKV